MADETQTADTNTAFNVKGTAKEVSKTPAAGGTPPVTGSPAGTGGVRLKGDNGEDLGVTLDTKGGAGQDASVADIASGIKGWSSLVIDGQPYEYSEANALALLQRFPQFVEQLR